METVMDLPNADEKGTSKSAPRNKRDRKQLKRMQKLAAKQVANAKSLTEAEEAEPKPQKTESKKRSGKLLNPSTRLKKRVRRTEEETEPRQKQESEDMAKQNIGHDDVEANSPVQQV